MSNQYPSSNPSDPSYPGQVPPYQGNPYQGGAYPGTPYQQSAGGPQIPASPVPQPPSYQSPAYRSPQAPTYPTPSTFPPTGALNGPQMPAGAVNGQQAPTAETPQQATRSKHGWIIITLIFLVVATPLILIIVIGNSFEFGEEKLGWILITSAVEFLFALGFFPFSAAVRRGIRQVTAQGRLEEAEKRRTGLYLSAFIAVVVGGYALYNGVPAAMDVADGQQSVTVTSCSYEQHKTEKRRRSHSYTTVYDNVFTFTLDDGTTHHTTLERYRAEDITHEGGLPGILYEACSRRSGSASLSMMVYRNTWIIVEARIK